jgi:hypothetical protein
MKDGPNRVLQGDPTHELIAGPDPAPDAHLKGQQHALEHATLRSHDEAGPQMSGPDSGSFCLGGSCLPFDTNRRLEVDTRATLFR